MRTSALVVVAALVLTACGGDDEVVGTESTVTTLESTSTTTTAAPAPTTSSTTASPGGTTVPGSLPGERLELFPYEGDELAVVGVAADDTLNLRAGPGVGFDVVAELAPMATGLIATGHNRSIEDGGIWAEVTADGATGWANSAYLAHLGGTDDITSQVVDAAGDRPRSETMLDLGTQVAGLRAGTDAEAEPVPEVVVVDGPSVGDLGEITVDVVGFADDSVLGERLRVFAQPDPGGGSFTLRTVEATTLCRRGVTDSLCL